MLKNLTVAFMCLCSVLGFSDSAANAKYRIGTVLAVTPHASDAGADSSNPSYEVSVKVGNTVYVVLYAPPLGMGTVKYATGRQVLVLVREKTIIYNDISGNPTEVPIISRKTVGSAGSN